MPITILSENSSAESLVFLLDMVMPRRSNATHPEEHRTIQVKPLADGTFTEHRSVDDCVLLKPGRTAVHRTARIDATAGFRDAMLFSPAVCANKRLPQRLHEWPRVVSRHILHGHECSHFHSPPLCPSFTTGCPTMTLHCALGSVIIISPTAGTRMMPE